MLWATTSQPIRALDALCARPIAALEGRDPSGATASRVSIGCQPTRRTSAAQVIHHHFSLLLLLSLFFSRAIVFPIQHVVTLIMDSVLIYLFCSILLDPTGPKFHNPSWVLGDLQDRRRLEKITLLFCLKYKILYMILYLD